MIIDFHNHFYPPAYLAQLDEGETNAQVERDEQGRLLLVHDGDYNIIVPAHTDLEARLAAMDASGIDMQVLSLTTPGVHIESTERGIYLAQLVNDAFAEIAHRYPDRFTALAALPLQDPEAAVAELTRTVVEGGLPGATLFTNVNGVALDDVRFRSLFARAAELNATLFVHPTIPTHIDLMQDYRLVPLVGFTHETTVAACRLVLSGIFENWPDLKIVLSHLGGHLPYLAERIVLGYRVYPECRSRLNRSPADDLKQFYMDTIPYAPRAIQFAADFAGSDRLLLGSDYPHQIGDLAGSVATVRDLPVKAEIKAQILGQNAAGLLGLGENGKGIFRHRP